MRGEWPVHLTHNKGEQVVAESKRCIDALTACVGSGCREPRPGGAKSD